MLTKEKIIESLLEILKRTDNPETIKEINNSLRYYRDIEEMGEEEE